MNRLMVLGMMIASIAAASAAESPLATAQPKAAQPAEGPKEKAKARWSDRCYTQAANCILSDPQRAGSSCWCGTPFGPSYGTVR